MRHNEDVGGYDRKLPFLSILCLSAPLREKNSHLLPFLGLELGVRSFILKRMGEKFEICSFFRAVDKFGINLINYTEITPGD